jgi:hypothetical protein
LTFNTAPLALDLEAMRLATTNILLAVIAALLAYNLILVPSGSVRAAGGYRLVTIPAGSDDKQIAYIFNNPGYGKEVVGFAANPDGGYVALMKTASGR